MIYTISTAAAAGIPAAGMALPAAVHKIAAMTFATNDWAALLAMFIAIFFFFLKKLRTFIFFKKIVFTAWWFYIIQIIIFKNF